jgi:hypothetical protein
VPELLRLRTLHIAFIISFINIFEVQQINKLNHPEFTEDGKNKDAICICDKLCHHPKT